MTLQEMWNYYSQHEQEMGEQFLNLIWSVFGMEKVKNDIISSGRGILAYKAENEWPINFYVNEDTNSLKSYIFIRGIYTWSEKNEIYQKLKNKFIKLCGEFGYTVEMDNPVNDGCCYFYIKDINLKKEVK